MNTNIYALEDSILVADALDAAVQVIQDTLGVRDGFSASLFFSGSDGDNPSDGEIIRQILAKYVRYEVALKEAK